MLKGCQRLLLPQDYTKPFGMKNAPTTFQCLTQQLTGDLVGCEGYIDNVVIYSSSWEHHVDLLHQLFSRLSQASLTINLAKSEFGHCLLTFLGRVVGQRKISLVMAKVEAVTCFPVPSNKRELMRFLGMAGYYRKFCHNFSVIVAPLTNLLKKQQPYLWTPACQSAFQRVKSLLLSVPVLVAPDFTRQFKLFVDASDIGAGAVLKQEDEHGIDHCVSYFSKKFDEHQKRYSTIEKETLGIMLALNHFDVYLNPTVMPIMVYTDHNPIVFINKMKDKNQQLLRCNLKLQQYNVDIRHIRGKENVIADALSRV